MNQLELTAAAVKTGEQRSKDGRTFRMDTATFVLPDGDSFKLTFNGLAVPLHAGDTAVFGIRSGLNDKGYEYASLSITACRAAAAAVESPSPRPVGK